MGLVDDLGFCRSCDGSGEVMGYEGSDDNPVTTFSTCRRCGGKGFESYAYRRDPVLLRPVSRSQAIDKAVEAIEKALKKS